MSRIAREVIEVADHLAKAIHTCERHPQKHKNFNNLQSLHKDLVTFLGKYEIYEVNPTGQAFDHNEHHAISQVNTNDPAKVNLVADTKRTGWKVRDRIIREAFVVIYKKREE